MANLLNAISRFVDNPTNKLEKPIEATSNRASSMGDMLESYVKKILSDSRDLSTKAEIIKKYSEVFSYTGNTNNPPDIMYMGGDAFEVKKVESLKAQLPLNSSFPKNKIYADDPKISQECRNCEDWSEKDIFYVVGHVVGGYVKHLWFVHGLCYAANKDCYQRVLDVISSGIGSLTSVELSPTNELARINKVDPLEITYLRVRGMWGIDSPTKLFDYVYKPPVSGEMSLSIILTKQKYDELEQGVSGEVSEKIVVEGVSIQNPNNPAKMMEAKLVTYSY